MKGVQLTISLQMFSNIFPCFQGYRSTYGIFISIKVMFQLLQLSPHFHVALVRNVFDLT